VAKAQASMVDVTLNSGDVIRSVNGQKITSLDDLRAALKAVPSGSPVVLQIQRDDRLQYVSFIPDSI